MFGEAGDLVWAAEYQTWGAVRRLWATTADNDNRTEAWENSPSSGGGGRTFGALALKGTPEVIQATQLCPTRFQEQWQDQETGLCYNRFRHYDSDSSQYSSSDPIDITGGLRAHAYVSQPLSRLDLFRLNDAASSLLKLKRRSVPRIENTIQNNVFSNVNSANTCSNNWRHPDGSEVKVHKYGNKNCCPYKSGNNAHFHKNPRLGTC